MGNLPSPHVTFQIQICFESAENRVGVGRAIAESISCLLPEMAVATPKILHFSIFGLNLIPALRRTILLLFAVEELCSNRSDIFCTVRKQANQFCGTLAYFTLHLNSVMRAV